MREIPPWLWIVGGVVVIGALLLARGSASATPTLTATPTPSDPNAEATAQAAIAGRTAAFQTLAGGLFGLRANTAGYQRDVNLGALSAGAAVTTNLQSEYYQTRRTALSEAGANTRTMLEQAGLTERTAYETAAATTQYRLGTERDVRVTDLVQGGETSRTRINAETGLSIADMQAALARYLGDLGFQTALDNNRTAASIAKTQAGVQRQANTNNLVRDLWGGLAALGALFL